MTNYIQKNETLQLTQYTVPFAPPVNSQQVAALDKLRNMTPLERTEFITELWYNDQLKEYARVAGEY